MKMDEILKIYVLHLQNTQGTLQVTPAFRLQ